MTALRACNLITASQAVAWRVFLQAEQSEAVITDRAERGRLYRPPPGAVFTGTVAPSIKEGEAFTKSSPALLDNNIGNNYSAGQAAATPEPDSRT